MIKPVTQKTILFLFSSCILLLGSTAFATLPWQTQGGEMPTLAPLLEKTIPAIVHIETRATVTARYRQSPFPFGNSQPPRQKQQSGAGSGVILDADKGLIVTNNHVIDKANDITVTLDDGRSYTASVVGKDADTDIAILKIEANDLVAIKFADSSQLRVGDFVIAIGNPFGLEQSVTSGIVSALGRSGLGIESYEDFIQTDASINPGNSGGALINLRGELVGINTAIFGPGGGNIGIGFAIPSNMANNVIKHLLEYGEVKRGRLGVAIQTLTRDLAKAFNVDQSSGVIITNIQKNSAAQKAGLMPGDIVLAINKQTVKDVSDMRNFIGLLRIGTEITLDILRDGQEKNIAATIRAPKTTEAEGGQYHNKLHGMLLQIVTESDKPYTRNGLLVKNINPRSIAYRSGLRRGDLITEVNQNSVGNFEDLESAVDKDKALLLQVNRGMRTSFLILR